MNIFQDVWGNLSQSENIDKNPADKLETLVTGRQSSRDKRSRMSMMFVSDKNAPQVDIRSFQPATALTNEGYEKEASSVHEDYAKNLDSFMENTEEMLSRLESRTSDVSASAVPFRLSCALSLKKISKDEPRKTIQIRDEAGELTQEFKEVLLRLAENRLQRALTEFQDTTTPSTKVCFSLVEGVLEYLNKAKQGKLEVSFNNCVQFLHHGTKVLVRNAQI